MSSKDGAPSSPWMGIKYEGIGNRERNIGTVAQKTVPMFGHFAKINK